MWDIGVRGRPTRLVRKTTNVQEDTFPTRCFKSHRLLAKLSYSTLSIVSCSRHPRPLPDRETTLNAVLLETPTNTTWQTVLMRPWLSRQHGQLRPRSELRRSTVGQEESISSHLIVPRASSVLVHLVVSFSKPAFPQSL